MAKNFLKQQNQNSSSKTSLLRLARNLAILLFLSPLFSCTDQGCIEADDFGDYEYQTLIIPANGLGTSCVYDYSLPIDDAGQGSGLISYLTTGNAKVTNTDGVEKNGDPGKGCSGFNEAELQNLCINDAIQKCLSLYNAGGATAEPAWTATGERDSSQNYGVTITPGAEITVKAIGSVTLGDQVSFSESYVSAVDYLPTLKDEDLTKDLFFDVKSGQAMNIKFSGRWNSDPSTIVGGGEISITDANANRIFNGARRAAIYVIPAPYGYKFNTSTASGSELERTEGVPLLPDPKAWQCSYTDANTANCSNKSYSTIGYTNVTSYYDGAINTAFPITSSTKSGTLGRYGGMIRWAGDGIVSDESFDPFAGSTTPTGIDSGGMVLGDASSGFSTTNSTSNSYKIAFRSTNSACNIPITVSIKDSNDAVLNSYESRPYDGIANKITISDLSWTPGNYTTEIALEPTQKVVVDPITATYTVDSTSHNCGESIQIKFVKYHDIEITQSGLVSFTMLNGDGASDNKCILHGSIINPSGNHLDVGSIKADFYEYDPLVATNPLYNLEVRSRADGYDTNWTSEIFVRKGQKIRFSPQSWNGTWKNGSTPQNSINCGIGMAMKIAPRPALLCRGNKTESVDNPSCSKDYSTGILNGCMAYDKRCDENDPSTYYCPATCQKPITCNTVTETTTKKTGCFPGLTPAGCSYTTPATSTTCDRCADIMLHNAQTSTTISRDVNQCYDLENYTGKVSNIPLATGFANLADDATAKGAVELGSFNGQYGNFKSFNDTGTVDSDHNNNKIYQTISPAIFSQEGRVRLLLLDGSDFLSIANTYNNNSEKSGGYSGINGFSVNFSGSLQYSNGEMLAAKLCHKNSGCTNPTNTLTPLIIGYGSSEPHPTTPINSESNYYFSSSGSLIRSTGVPVGDTTECQISNPSWDGKAVTESGSTFYCHNQTTYNGHDIDSKDMRLTFKIIDPETTNCDIPDSPGSELDGIKLSNPAYDPTISGTEDTTCASGEVPSLVISNGQTQCKKKFYCANKYTNNSGSYSVTIKTKKLDDGNISQIIGNVITPVVEIIDGSADGKTPGQAERMYKLLIADAKYQTILSLCLTLMITFYAMATLMGVSEITHTELVNRVIKIGLIYLFVGPEGWYWFNEIVVKFFKNSTDYLAFMMASAFDNSPEITHAIQNNDYYDKSILFSSVDKVFNMFFSEAVQKKISALLFSNIFGIVYMWIIYLSFMLYVGAVCHAVLYYLTAQVFISILFILAPLFFVLTLFGQTKEMFDNWIKQLIGFSLQQIFLLVTLAFFNMMMYEVIRMALGYKICWDVVWSIKIIGTIDLLSFWTIPSISSAANSQVGNISGQDGIPSLFSILFIWVVASLMNKFISFMTDLAAGISGGMKASALGAGVKSTFQGAINYSKAKYNDLYKSNIGKQIERLDEKLFDSGASATANRKKRQQKHFEDAQKKGVLRDIGNKAVEDFKKEEASKLVGLDAEGQRKKLEQVKNDAMMKHSKEKFGLSEDDTKKLLSSKGSTYEGSNAFGFALHSGRQLVSGGGTLTKSINNEGVSTKLTEDQANSAMKKKRMTEDQRKQFVESVEKGNIKVERNTLGKIKGAIGSPGQTIKNAASSAKGSVAEGYDSLRSAMGAGSYRKAEKALEERGDIKKMVYGTSFSRTDEEKNKIKAEQQKMKTAENDKKAGTSLNNPYAVKNVQRDADKARGIESNKTDKERVAENKEKNLAQEREKLNMERSGLEGKEFEIGKEDGSFSNQTGQSMSDDALNQNIKSLQEQNSKLKSEARGDSVKSAFAAAGNAIISPVLLFSSKENKQKRAETKENIKKDRAERNAKIKQNDSNIKDLQRIKKLRKHEGSASMAHQKYEQDKKSVQDVKQVREDLLGKSTVRNILKNAAKDTANVLTGDRAFKGRAEAKKEWANSAEKAQYDGKEYKEAKESVKSFLKDLPSRQGVSATTKGYNKYNKSPDKKKSAKASIEANEDDSSEDDATTKRQDLIANPMISQEVAAQSYMEEPTPKEAQAPKEKPKASVRDKNKAKEVLNPLHKDDDE